MDECKIFLSDELRDFVKKEIISWYGEEFFEGIEKICDRLNDDSESVNKYPPLYPEELAYLVQTTLEFVGSLQRFTHITPSHVTVIYDELQNIFDEILFYSTGSFSFDLYNEICRDYCIATMRIVLSVLGIHKPYSFTLNAAKFCLYMDCFTGDRHCSDYEEKTSSEFKEYAISICSLENNGVCTTAIKREVVISYIKTISKNISGTEFDKSLVRALKITDDSNRNKIISDNINCNGNSITRVQNEIISLADNSVEKGSFIRELKKLSDEGLFSFKYGLGHEKMAKTINAILELEIDERKKRGDDREFDKIYPLSRSAFQRNI